MTEIGECEFSDEIPQQAINHIFNNLQSHLTESDRKSTVVSLIPHARLFTVEQDMELFGELLQISGQSLNDYISENWEDYSEEKLEAMQPPNAITRRFL